jgi:ABC-type transport system involved in multi-copper enzyme maturation permease subunit
MFLFWVENVIIGIFNVLKMLIAEPSDRLTWAAKMAAIPFFCFHYGMFTFVHGLFLMVLFGGFFDTEDFPGWNAFTGVITENQLYWAILILFLSHLVSYVFNYIIKGEYKKSTLNNLMSQPYKRIVILHITILLCGFLVMTLGIPVIGLVILLVLKNYFDIRAHVRQHTGYSRDGQETETSPSA